MSTRRRPVSTAPGFLIALPRASGVSGITTWAVRLLSGLAQRGRIAGVVLHGDDPAPALPTGVSVYRVDPRRCIDTLEGDLSSIAPAYRDAVRDMMAQSAGPVILSPNHTGDCYGVAAELLRDNALDVRIVGWAHSDNAYDAEVLTHYEAVLSRFVGVSSYLAGVLADRMTGRAHHTVYIPYGVPRAQTEPPRDRESDEVLRLMYAGRLEDRQKRATALLALARRLVKLGVPHRLDIFGDGPLIDAFRAARADLPSIAVHGAVGNAEIQRAFGEADALVLPSRYEGLSVAMLEAMAAGCAPVIADVRSGAADAIEDGRTGLRVAAGPEASPEETGRMIAEAIARCPRDAIAKMGEAARARAATEFGLDRHLDRVERMLDAVAAEPARRWPADRPTAFSGAGGGSGSTPEDAPERMLSALRGCPGGRVVIHGTGRHTKELEPVLFHGEHGTEIVAFTDDNPARWGDHVRGVPVLDPAAAGVTRATSVIISSRIHEAEIWARRAVYEGQGLRVHRLYGPASQ